MATKKASKKASAASVIRGRELAEKVVARLAGPDSPIGEPLPMSAEQIRACEEAMGVALSPFMAALFAYDRGWVTRELGLFDDDGDILAERCFDLIEEQAGPASEAYDAWCTERFTGNAVELEAEADSMRFVYFGAPDEHGEYPVLNIDYGEVPLLGVQHAGFDLWVAEQLGIQVRGADDLLAEYSRRLLGSPNDWDFSEETDVSKLPKLAPAPAPGSITHVPLAAPKKAKPRMLTGERQAKALREHARDGNGERVKQLIEGAPREALDAAFVDACRGHSSETMQLLLDAGASPNARDNYGGALNALIRFDGDLEQVRSLLDAGADPNAPGSGKAALFDAIQRGDEAIARLLIERGADVNHAADRDRPLDQALQQKNPRFVSILCEAAASVDPGEDSILVWAIRTTSAEHVRRLIAHGAPVNKPSKHQPQSPLHTAFETGRDDVAAMLIAAGADLRAVDWRGISLERVYGADGADRRPLRVQYAGSAEPQRVDIELEVAILAPGNSLAATRMTLGRWLEWIAGGAAGEGEFAPETSRAQVVRTTHDEKIDEVGIRRVYLELELTAVSCGFVRWLSSSWLADQPSPSAQGVAPRTVRLMSVTVKGAHPAAELKREALRTEPPRTWPQPLPFELVVTKGKKPTVVVTPADVGDVPKLVEPVRRAGSAWVSLLPRLPGAASLDMLAAPDVVAKKDRLEFGLYNLLQLELVLPVDGQVLAPQLGQVMRTVHAVAPIARVELIAP